MSIATGGPQRFRTPESVLNTLRGQGLRVSTLRRIVVASLFAAGEPISAGELAKGADGSAGLDLASVYRNLEQLERLGVVQALRTGNGPARYTLAGERRREYLECERCGALQEVDPDELDQVREEIRRRFGFEARFSCLPLSGRCCDCAGGLNGHM